MGDSDVREMNLDRTTDNIQGAAVDYVNHCQIDDTQKHQVGKSMGVPTERLPDGTHISDHQSKPVGKRYYSGGLGKAAGKGTSMPGSSARKRAPLVQQRSPSRTEAKGVSPMRTKKKLRQCAMKGTPSTANAAEEVLDNMANGVSCSATDAIIDAEEDSEPEENSQDIANMAIHLKKLETKRKENKN